MYYGGRYLSDVWVVRSEDPPDMIAVICDSEIEWDVEVVEGERAKQSKRMGRGG